MVDAGRYTCDIHKLYGKDPIFALWASEDADYPSFHITSASSHYNTGHA